MVNNLFEQIRKLNKYGQEFWSARDLYKLLGYTEYGKFLPAIERAKEACENSGQSVEDHFAHASEMIRIATGTAKEAIRELNDYHLSRYACYLACTCRLLSGLSKCRLKKLGIHSLRVSCSSGSSMTFWHSLEGARRKNSKALQYLRGKEG